jgi:hypothetical protein
VFYLEFERDDGEVLVFLKNGLFSLRSSLESNDQVKFWKTRGGAERRFRELRSGFYNGIDIRISSMLGNVRREKEAPLKKYFLSTGKEKLFIKVDKDVGFAFVLGDGNGGAEVHWLDPKDCVFRSGEVR